MVNRLLAAAALAAAAATSIGVGCGDSTGGGGSALTDCTTATVFGYSSPEVQAAFAKCTTCHDSTLVGASERQLATDGFDYETYENAKKFPANIREQVEDDEMPEPALPQLTAAEKTNLLAWVDCGTPE